VFYLSLVSV